MIEQHLKFMTQAQLYCIVCLVLIQSSVTLSLLRYCSFWVTYCILVKQMPFEVILRIAVSSLSIGQGQFCTFSRRYFWKVTFCNIGHLLTHGQTDLLLLWRIGVWGLLYRIAISRLFMFWYFVGRGQFCTISKRYFSTVSSCLVGKG